MQEQSNLKRRDLKRIGGVRPGVNQKTVRELYFGRGTESNPKISPIANGMFVMALAENKAGYHCWESDSELDELIKYAEKRASESTGKICNAKRALESAENIGDAKRARVCANIGESTDSSNYDAPAETSDSDTVKKNQTDQEEETDAETSDSDTSDSDTSDSETSDSDKNQTDQTDHTDQGGQEEETDAGSSDSDTDEGDTPATEIQDEVRSPTIGELFTASANEQMTGSPAPVFDLGSPGTPATPVYLDIFEGIPGLGPTEPQEFSP